MLTPSKDEPTHGWYVEPTETASTQDLDKDGKSRRLRDPERESKKKQCLRDYSRLLVFGVQGDRPRVRAPPRKPHSGTPPSKRPVVAIPLFSRTKATLSPHAVRIASNTKGVSSFFGERDRLRETGSETGFFRRKRPAQDRLFSAKETGSGPAQRTGSGTCNAGLTQQGSVR